MNKAGTAILILLTGVLLPACKRSGYTGSAVPNAVVLESLVERCGIGQKARIVDRAGGGGTDADSHEEHRQYVVTIASGTAGQVVSRIRAEVEKLTLDSGQTVYGPETVAREELRDFALHYASDHHKGVVRVYTADVSTNAFRLIVFCYEHRR